MLSLTGAGRTGLGDHDFGLRLDYRHRVAVPGGIYDGLVATGIVDFLFETAYAGIAWLCWGAEPDARDLGHPPAADVVNAA